MKPVYRVGVFGGIASGKSVLIEHLRELGASVLSADEENRELWKEDEYLLSLAKLFPEAVIPDNKRVNTNSPTLTSNDKKTFVPPKVDKRIVKEIIFSDPERKAKLELISHSRIRASLMEKSKEGLWFIEIPVYVKDFMPLDEIWEVVTPLGDRVYRLIERDGISEELARKIIGQQPIVDEPDKITVFNNGDFYLFRRRVEGLYKQTLETYEN